MEISLRLKVPPGLHTTSSGQKIHSVECRMLVKVRTRQSYCSLGNMLMKRRKNTQINKWGRSDFCVGTKGVSDQRESLMQSFNVIISGTFQCRTHASIFAGFNIHLLQCLLLSSFLNRGTDYFATFFIHHSVCLIVSDSVKGGTHCYVCYFLAFCGDLWGSKICCRVHKIYINWTLCWARWFPSKSLHMPHF